MGQKTHQRDVVGTRALKPDNPGGRKQHEVVAKLWP